MKKILAFLVVAIVGFCIYVATRPSHFKITRSISIAAKPRVIFDQVNDFHKWVAWSPWAKLDPNAKVGYEGPSSGIAASFHWAGNREVGEGKQTIVESIPDERIAIRLDFAKPMAATSTAEFTFVPQGEQTLVTWSMEGNNNFIGRAMCVFMNMDKMVGGRFDEGLASLKEITENSATPRS
jgi:hypothetical protein